MPQLPRSARECHIIPDLASYSLISVVKLCEAGCEVSFKKWVIGVEFRYRGQMIIKGSCWSFIQWIQQNVSTPQNRSVTKTRG